GSRVRATRSAREVRQRRLPAAIGYLEQRDRAFARHRLRAQDHEIRGGDDAPARIPWRTGEVHDGGIGGIGRVESEHDDPGKLLVAARRPDGAPAANARARTIGGSRRTARRPPRRERRLNETREAAGNGLLDRRAFLAESAGALATGAFMAFAPGEAGAAGPPETPTEMKVSGAPLSAYGAPATFEGEVTRTLIRSQPGTTGAGASPSPLEAPEGIRPPSGLHFERHHNGVPAIDPAQHQLLIHGMVARPLIFTVASL